MVSHLFCLVFQSMIYFDEPIRYLACKVVLFLLRTKFLFVLR